MTTPVPGPPRAKKGYRVVAKEPDRWYFVPEGTEEYTPAPDIATLLADMPPVEPAVIEVPVNARRASSKGGTAKAVDAPSEMSNEGKRRRGSG